jgi:energy-coupling factor transporter ATP-binding protein EcfA2
MGYPKGVRSTMTSLSRGSEWRRWEPHIHAPGTVMNDQFKGPSAWEDYLSALEAATPTIQAIAITDYYVLDNYKKVREFMAAGRLPNTKLAFPNVEMRLDVATAKGGFVNIHLLVSPDDPNLVAEIERFLSRLHFRFSEDRYDCTRKDLIRLGKKLDDTIIDDNAALANGANQFKVNFSSFREVFGQSDWAKRNILIAVAAGSSDGTSGVKEAADQAIRKEIEGFAHIIFSSSEAQREFWLGKKSLSPIQIVESYRSLKPCLHGSDAHGQDKVAKPFGDRYSWIKGDLEFDSLRQACIDPASRAFVGIDPPSTATPSQVLSEIQVNDAPWLANSVIPLNPGLVAIIGARGSGKTALAEMIAAGCDAISEVVWNSNENSNPSFLIRARPLLGNGKVEVQWAAGSRVTRALDGSDANGASSYPRARYLSQQFVEELCSSDGMTDKLLREIERVIFESHSEKDRDGTQNFDELQELRASRHRLAREREAETVAQVSERISEETEKTSLVPSLKAQLLEKTNLIVSYTADCTKLVSKGGNERWARRHAEIASAANQLKANLKQLTNQRQTFLAIQDEVKNLRTNQAPEALRKTQARHAQSGMNEQQWKSFLLDYKGKVDGELDGYVRRADEQIAKIKGTAPTANDGSTPYFADDTVLDVLSLAMLDAEMARLEKLVSTDREIQLKYTALTGRIATETMAQQALTEKLKDYDGAKERVRVLLTEREQAYGRAFEALIAEQAVLEELYAPLLARLRVAAGTLKKLTFSVARTANVEKWTSVAEEGLIDLRKSGPFKGKGTLLEKANQTLKVAWQTGDSASVIAAMTRFREQYQDDLLQHAPFAPWMPTEYRGWTKRFAQWLFSTDHINISYGIEYDGIDIRKLSPGTRGIVLLLLYLALDDGDDRPLIIDQPEENLDPKSVFEELVTLFIEAKSKRQVIIVTHNANLVINTDADQIIVAQSGPHASGSLPSITYITGGLENGSIRKDVCDILEGGEGAFQERARRLRVGLER